MSTLILTSSFHTVANDLRKKEILPISPQRVAFIPTASDIHKSAPWQEADRKALRDLGYSVFDVGLKDKTAQQLKAELQPANIIFVGGGNTTYLVEHVHQSGFDTIVRDLLADGRMYIGSSAGSILAGPSVELFVEEDLPELPKDFVLHSPQCLGLVDYIILPHYPEYAEYDKKAMEKFGDRFKCVQLRDEEYRVVTV